MNRIKFLLLITIPFLFSCKEDSSVGVEDSSVESERKITVEVGSKPAICIMGVLHSLCPLMNQVEGDPLYDNEYFVGRISGFDHKWGFKYVLELTVIEVEFNADVADDYQSPFVLSKIISSEEDEIGELYEQRIHRFDYALDSNTQGYSLLGQAFTCGSTIDCDELIELYSEVHLELTFEYLGNSRIELVGWKEWSGNDP